MIKDQDSKSTSVRAQKGSKIHAGTDGVSLKICHAADIHLGYRKYQKLSKNGANQRELDIAISFREMIDRMIGLNPDVIILAGDIFHQVRPSNAAVTFAFKELRRLRSGTTAPIILIAGNHESPKRSDTGCILRLFEEIQGVYVADLRAETFRFEALSLCVAALPHAALEQISADPSPTGGVSVAAPRADDAYQYNILAAHGQIGDSWMSEFGGIEKKLSELHPHEWDYIALGHIHLAKQVELNAWFSGAIEHTATNIWSEADNNKGFLEITLPEKKVTFHSLTSPRTVLSLPPIFGGSIDSAETLTEKLVDLLSTVAGGVDGKIIRVELIDVARELYRHVDQKALKDFRQRALHLQIDLRYSESSTFAREREISRAAALPRTASLKQELIDFTQKQSPKPHVNQKAVIELFESLFNSLEQADEAR